MSLFRGAIPLGVLLAVSTTAARAEPVKSLGLDDFASTGWSIRDATVRDEMQLQSTIGNRATVAVVAVRGPLNCKDIVTKQRPDGAVEGAPGRLARDRGFHDDVLFFVCRESRGRMITMYGVYDSRAPIEPQESLYLSLIDDVDRALARQKRLRLVQSGWDLGNHFARWHATVNEGSDALDLVGPDEVPTTVSIVRTLSTCADRFQGDTPPVKRPSFVPPVYGDKVYLSKDVDTTTVACLDHGAGRYNVFISQALGNKARADRKTDASVTEILGAIAKAIAASPAITADEVSGASDLSDDEEDDEDEDEDEPAPALAPTPAPASTPPPAPAADETRVASADPVPAPVELPGYASSTRTSSESTSRRSTRGWYAESPVLMVRVHQLAFDATMAAEGTDAIGGSIAVERPLVIEEFGGAEWSGAVGYDELGGLSFDVRGGVGMWFARPMTLRVGAGIDGWRGTDTGGELPTDVYAYIGGQVPVGPVSVRAEYLPRNGGTDEKRLRVGFTKLRHAGRKIVVAGDAQFFDGATVLSLGVGAGI